MTHYPLTYFALASASVAALVCCLWSVLEFAASYRRATTGKGMSCIPAVPALASLLAPLMYVRSFRGGEVPWPEWRDLGTAALIIIGSIPGSFVIGSMIPQLLAEKAASDLESRRFWIVCYLAWLLLTVGICVLSLVLLSYNYAIFEQD